MRPATARLLLLSCVVLALTAVGAWFTLWNQTADGPGGLSVPQHNLLGERDDGPEEAPSPTSVSLTSEPVQAGPELEAPSPAATEEREAVAVSLGDDLAGRVAGRVVSPPGVPEDEVCYVVAFPEEKSISGLYARRGPLAQALDEEGQGSEPEEELARARVDADGSFALDLPEGTTAAHLAVHARYQYSMQTLAVPRSEMRHSLALHTELGAFLEGQIVASDGAGAGEMEDLLVELGPDLSAGFDAMGIAGVRWTLPKEIDPDENGHFEIAALPANTDLVLFVREATRIHLPQSIEALEPGASLAVEAELSTGSTLAGHVVDESGAGIPDAQVEVRFGGAEGEIFDELRETETDATGAFVLEGAPWGRLQLRAEARGRLKTRKNIEVAEGEALEGLEIVLESGASIAGRVRFADGSPAVGANLYARPDLAALAGPAAMNLARAETGWDESNAEGGFQMSGLAQVAYIVTASLELEEGDHAGAWNATQRGVNPGDDLLELILEPRLDLRGRATDLEGVPLSDFTVFALLQDSGGMFGLGAEKRREPVSDAEDGAFVMEGLRTGTWEISVDAEGYGLSESQLITMPDAATAAPLQFALGPAAQVEGLVTDPSGRVLPGARVELVLDLGARMASAETGGPKNAITDNEGFFLLEDLDPGALSIQAKHAGYAPSEPLPLELHPGQDLSGVELRLRNGATVTGEVLNQDGEPAVGRSVLAQSMPEMTSTNIMTSDEDGEFRFENLRPGKWQIISMGNVFDSEAQPDDLGAMMGDMAIEIVELEDGDEVHVVLGAQAENPVVLTGQVLHAGEPVSGVIVSLVPEDAEGFGDLKIVFTDEEGQFSANLDHAGPYLASVQRTNGGTQQNTVEFQVHVPEEVEAHHEEIELPVGRITGRVTDDGGDPIPDCRVTLQVDGGIRHGSFLGGHYAEIATNANGEYSLDWLRPGTYSVAAGGAAMAGLLGDDSRAGRSMRSGLSLSEGEWIEGVDFRLGEPSQLSGVVRFTDGSPAEGATVFVRNADGGMLERFSFVTTDAAGRFTYPGLSPGYYSASAQLGSQSSAESSVVQVGSGAAIQLDLSLQPATTLIVSVVDNSGNEVQATVSVRDDEGREWTGMRSFLQLAEAFGQGFSSTSQRIGPVPPGRYDVEVLTSDGRRGRKPVNVSGQLERKVKVRLR